MILINRTHRMHRHHWLAFIDLRGCQNKHCISRSISTFLVMLLLWSFNTLRPRQNGRHFPDDISKCIFLNENVLISMKISLKFVPKGQINNIPALVQIIAWRRPGDKPLSNPVWEVYWRKYASLSLNVLRIPKNWKYDHEIQRTK